MPRSEIDREQVAAAFYSVLPLLHPGDSTSIHLENGMVFEIKFRDPAAEERQAATDAAFAELTEDWDGS